jgi:putative endonuclease
MNAAGAYYIYILASGYHGTLYIGVYNDLGNRLTLHRSGRGPQFVKKYRVTRLVYMEEYASPQEAIRREKQLKNWRRDWKIQLIEENNPDWRDLSHLLRHLWVDPGIRRDDSCYCGDVSTSSPTSLTAACPRSNSHKTFRRTAA